MVIPLCSYPHSLSPCLFRQQVIQTVKQTWIDISQILKRIRERQTLI